LRHRQECLCYLLNTARYPSLATSLVTHHFFTEENMPYIRGRYYMNPVVGDALEAAREAEAALQALEHAAKVARGDTGEEDDAGASSSGANGGSSASGSSSNSNADAYAKSAPGPIHRVEIEAAELVPAHSGRAQRGFVARIHRRASDAGVRTAGVPPAQLPAGSSSPFARNSSSDSARPDASRPSAMPPAPETHVFSNHNDLTNFLHDQFAEDCK
jgi:hypothetical protein